MKRKAKRRRWEFPNPGLEQPSTLSNFQLPPHQQLVEGQGAEGMASQNGGDGFSTPTSASAKTPSFEDSALDEEWTVVQRGRSKKRKHFTVTKAPEVTQPWSPADTNIDPERVAKLTRKLDLSMKKLETSQFYHTFIDQMEGQDISSCFHKVLGSEPRLFQMVVYGIGSIESYEPPRLQLSLALLMKKKFSWIGGIEVFDPVLSATESQVLESLGCSVLSVNEQGRRNALNPTLFFMPHCEAELYDNLIATNWKSRSLERIVVFGNSFERYAHNSEFKGSTVVHSAKHVLAAMKFADEFKIATVSDDFFAAFHDSSWHFFGAVGDFEPPFATS